MRLLHIALPVVAIAWLTTAAAAQTPVPGASPVPRLPDGRPDLQGAWSGIVNADGYFPSGSYDIEEGNDPSHRAMVGQQARKRNPIVDPPDGRIPYLPWAAVMAEFLHAEHLGPSKLAYLDPQAQCFLDGVPRINYQTRFEIIQAPSNVVFLYDFGHMSRIVPMDGRPHVSENIRLWMGDSRGRWEGDTLVIDVTNQTDQTWLDIVGNFHSDGLHVVERWTLTDANTLAYEAMLDDPAVYARPWKLAFPMRRLERQEQWEFACHEGVRLEDLLHNAR
jgi:hypothetical protein